MDIALIEKLDQVVVSERGVRFATKAHDILQIAGEVFVQQGFANFGLRAVAAKAGIRLASLQYYFPTNEALLESTVRNLMGSYLDDTMDILSQRNISAEHRLLNFINYNFSEISKNSTNLLFFEVWSVAQRHELVRDIVTDNYAKFLDAISELIAQLNPKLAGPVLRQRAALLIAQTEGIMLFTFKGAPPIGDLEMLCNSCYQAVRALCLL